MNIITYSDFEKLDIRIGTVTKAEVPEWSHWVIKLEVDFGKELGKRKIFAGMMKFYKPKDFEGKQFPFVVNIKPKKIGPAEDFSEGMMLAICDEDNEDIPPVLLKLSKKVPNGSKVR